MRDPLPTKGIPMLILETLLAIAIFLAVGVAFNCIGHLVSK